jgi:predicted Holliday junction resolvase-like endonuclease
LILPATILSINYTLLTIVALIILALTTCFFAAANHLNLNRADRLMEDHDLLNKAYFKLEEKKQTAQRDLYLLRNELQALDGKYDEALRVHKLEYEKEIRKDANQRSRSVLRGKATEHLAPLMIKDVPIEDYRFMGSPIDFVVFNGASAIHDKTEDTIKEVMFLDIKTGKASLSKVQRRIRDAIVENRVTFAVYNPDTEELRKWEPKQENIPETLN